MPPQVLGGGEAQVRLVLGLPSAGSTPPTVFASEKSKQVLKFREVMN